MIIFQERKYDSIKKFDCHILDFHNNTGGGYFTCLPISPLKHRQGCQRNFPDKVEITKDESFTHFAITDDWGTVHTVSIGNEHKAEIETATQAAKEQGLLL